MNLLLSKDKYSVTGVLESKKVSFLEFFLISVFTSIISFPTIAAENKLAPGDIISITVYGESDLSINNIRISESGTISYPLIGTLSLVDKTTTQLEREIVKKLKKGFLKQPRVSIVIQQYRPFFVNGQVASPGAFPYVDGLTIRKAFTIAGGLTDRASTKKIFLIKEAHQTKKIQVNDWEVEINPGDILTVGESLF